MILTKFLQKKATLILILIPVLTATAQDDVFPDDTQDVPSAPIDDYIIIGLIIAICIAFRLFKKQYTINNEINKQ